jgi:hypothetical protein
MADEPTAAAEPLIHDLAAAVVSTAPGVRGKLLYVGWTADGAPAATPTAGGLSEDARASLTAFRGSGLTPRRVPYAALVPSEYVATGPAIDYADSPGRRAEDQVRYTVVDSQEATRDVAIGELSVLQAIADARAPFQALARGTGGELTVDTVPLYTVFVGLPDAQEGTGLAIMFRPTVAGRTNEAAFRSFVRLTVGRLLVLDESAPRELRKGYLDVAGRVAGVGPKGGFLETLVTLRKLGFVDFSDNWLRDMQMASRKAQGQFLRVLRALGMVEIEDEILDELTNPRPDYDVDQLETGRLLDLASAMADAARRALRP